MNNVGNLKAQIVVPITISYICQIMSSHLPLFSPYSRDFILYRFPGKPPTYVTDNGYEDKVRR